MVRDRAAGAGDRVAGGGLRRAPLLELLALASGHHEGEVQRGAGLVEVRDVAADERRVRAQGAPDGLVEPVQAAPRVRGLERLDEDAAVEEVVAQVRAVVARAQPRPARPLPDAHAAGLAQDAQRAPAPAADLVGGALPPDDDEARAADPARPQVGAQRLPGAPAAGEGERQAGLVLVAEARDVARRAVLGRLAEGL